MVDMVEVLCIIDKSVQRNQCCSCIIIGIQLLLLSYCRAGCVIQKTDSNLINIVYYLHLIPIIIKDNDFYDSIMNIIPYSIIMLLYIIV